MANLGRSTKFNSFVAVFSIIFSLAIWGVDTVFSRVIEAYFQWIKLIHNLCLK